MPIKPTFCEDCQNLSKVNKADHPSKWLCLMHPRLSGFGFVCKDVWDKFPPYLYAVNVNGGLCPLYKEVKRLPTEPTQETNNESQ